MTSLMSWNWITFSWFLFLYSSYFYKHHNQSPIYRRYLLILKTFGIYTTWNGCSLHDRVCSSNSVAALDGWMDSWVFERATFQRMLNVASPHTSRDTLLCCIDVVCEWGAFGENKKKDVKEAGECDEMRQKFYLARYTIYMYAYTFIVYIVTWIIFAAEHIMAAANTYYMVERERETAFSTRFQRYKSLNRFAAMHTSHAY